MTAEGIMDFQQVLQRSMGMIELCKKYILTGKAEGIVAARLRVLIGPSLRRRIKQQYESDEITGELVLVLYTVWKRYMPEQGDFAPYLVSCFHYEAFQSFKHIPKLAHCNSSTCEVGNLASPSSVCAWYTDLDNWTFATPELQHFMPRDEQILRMRFIHGLYVYEIANALGLSAKTVQRSLKRTCDYIRSRENIKRHVALCRKLAA